VNTQLLERERCLADLSDWLDAAAEHGGIVALVAGEAGIGKTTLLQQFARQQRRVSRVLWGACDALFTPRPLAPLHDIARQVQKGLLTALCAGDRDAIFNAALDELEGGPPALVVLEDMHWADEATLDLLKFLGRRIQRTRSLLVLTYRDDEVGTRHPLRLVIGELPRVHVRRQRLDALSESAVAELARGAGRPAAGLHSATGGNPFFITEVLAAGSDAAPVTVRDAVLARALRLAPASREIAELVSLIPGKAEAWLLEEALHPEEAGIEGCLDIGMIRGEDGSLAFRHELARRSLEGSIPQPRLRALHAKVLAILSERQGISSARLAHHADFAHNADEVLRYAPAAAAQAVAVGSHSEAASHYRVALRYAGDLAAEDQARLQELLSYECYLTDQVGAAAEARQAALDVWRAAGNRLKEGDSLRWLSRLSWFLGRRAEADRYAAEAVAALEALSPGPELAMAYSNCAQLAMLRGDVDSAVDWARRAIAIAEPAGFTEILSHALNNLGSANYIVGNPSGKTDLERSLSLALENRLQEHAGRAYTNLGSMSVEQRRYADASRYLDAGLAYCQEHDLDSWFLYMLAWRARLKFEVGDWNSASADAEQVLAHPRISPVSRIPALTILGHMRVLRGDTDASSPLDQARELAERADELQRLAPLACALADAAWINDDVARIPRDVRAAYALTHESRDPWMKGKVAAWMWRAGALESAPDDVAEPYRLELSGNWRGAANAWHELRCPYEQAIVLTWHGDEPAQLAALEILQHLGATAAANALRRKMRARGVLKIPRGSRATTRSHPQGLTRREVQVLDLLAHGMRNATIAKRLFLSTKTVDHHVSAILTKLGVPSREEAAAFAHRKKSE
jgi:DNA-binding CsgD family transcriptional regulator/tetratricopeptide (TPR) repeat protein